MGFLDLFSYTEGIPDADHLEWSYGVLIGVDFDYITLEPETANLTETGKNSPTSAACK